MDLSEIWCKSLCQLVHETLISGKCPWCGHTIVDGRDTEAAAGDFEITDFTEVTVQVTNIGKMPLSESVRQKMLEQSIVFLKHPNAAARAGAAALLGQIGPDAREALPALRLLLKDEDQQVRDAAGEAIKKIDVAE